MPFLQLLAHNPDHVALLTDISGSAWSPAAGGLGPKHPIPAADGGLAACGPGCPRTCSLPSANSISEASKSLAKQKRTQQYLSVCPSKQVVPGCTWSCGTVSRSFQCLSLASARSWDVQCLPGVTASLPRGISKPLAASPAE